MQFRKPHPWDGKYAIPESVMAEPTLRGTFTSKGIPRRTFDNATAPKPWQGGYSVPQYVLQEPIGQGVYRTKYIPRRTVDTLVPQYLGGLLDLRLSNPLVLAALGFAVWKLVLKK